MNWSPVTMLRKTPDEAVAPTSFVLVFAALIITNVMLSTIRLAIMTLPNSMAHIISQMVLSIPAIPRVATNWLRASFPISICVEPKSMVVSPLIVESRF